MLKAFLIKVIVDDREFILIQLAENRKDVYIYLNDYFKHADSKVILGYIRDTSKCLLIDANLDDYTIRDVSDSVEITVI